MPKILVTGGAGYIGSITAHLLARRRYDVVVVDDLSRGHQHNLGRLRALGVKLSIDDFGTGHSSLSQLQQTDVDILKIDQSFVSVMDHDAPSAAIVSAIITLGHAMGLTLVAEGVETPAQAALLREQGCDAAQGWLFGQPLPAEAVDQAFGITFPAMTHG